MQIESTVSHGYFRPGHRSHAPRWSAHAHLLEEIELADKVGLDVFGIGDIIGRSSSTQLPL